MKHIKDVLRGLSILGIIVGVFGGIYYLANTYSNAFMYIVAAGGVYVIAFNIGKQWREEYHKTCSPGVDKQSDSKGPEAG